MPFGKDPLVFPAYKRISIGFENGPFLFFENKRKISQNVLQKSATFKNDFLIFGRVKIFVGPSTSFLTPNFLSGAS